MYKPGIVTKTHISREINNATYQTNNSVKVCYFEQTFLYKKYIYSVCSRTHWFTNDTPQQKRYMDHTMARQMRYRLNVWSGFKSSRISLSIQRVTLVTI